MKPYLVVGSIIAVLFAIWGWLLWNARYPAEQ